MRRVEVIPHQPNWKVMFEKESQLLHKVFQSEIIQIHHIGSTSVPGLCAKPIIDIMPVVGRISSIDTFNEQMTKFKYEPKGEYGIPGRRFYTKGGDKRTHHIHIFELGSPHVIRHLAFRDYLISHPEIAEQYGKLKNDLAYKYPDDMESYIDGKQGFVTMIEQTALRWYENQ